MNIGRVAEFTTPTPAAKPETTVEQSAKKNTTSSADRPHTDRYEAKSEVSYTPAYTKASSKTNSHADEKQDNKGMAISKPKSFVSAKNQAFQSMVADIIGKQSGAAYNAIMKDAYQIQNGTIDDYWSADATAQRIYDFARALAGDDDSKLETLRAAVQKGFKAAGASFSKSTGMSGLPSICQDTYSKVMNMFDDWKKESGDTTKSGDSSFKPSGYSVTNKKQESSHKTTGYSVTNKDNESAKAE